MGRISRDARLLFVQMWTKADDEGRLRGNPRLLAGSIFPYDSDAPNLIDGWLDELEREESILRYDVAGNAYIQIVNFSSHQKIDKPKKSKLPEPIRKNSRHVGDTSATDQRHVGDTSRHPSEPLREKSVGRDQGRDQGSGKGMEGIREISPTPLARGEISLAEFSEDELNRAWWKFHEEMKRQLCDQPMGHPNFSDVVRGETDWGSCFEDWRLVTATKAESGLILHTTSPRPAATEAGLCKYAKRIAKIAIEVFPVPAEFRVADPP